jgi:hypothetical protein
VTDQTHKCVEQIAIERLLDNAYETFDQQLLSISGTIVLWGSVGSSDELRDRYLSNKGKKTLLDRRHRQTVDEENEWIDFDNAARDAWDYLQWAKKHSGQPIARESLIAYFTAFENCLKSIATAFLVASHGEAKRVDGQIFIPLLALNKARRKIGELWRSREYRDGPKGKLFFENEIVQKNSFPSHYVFHPIGKDIWDRIGAAYKVRNAIAHSMGLATDQFDFGGRSLYPGDEIEVEAKSLKTLAEDFRKLLNPFRTEPSMDDL